MENKCAATHYEVLEKHLRALNSGKGTPMEHCIHSMLHSILFLLNENARLKRALGIAADGMR